MKKEKLKIFYISFQMFLSKRMGSDKNKHEVIHCPKDDENRTYWEFCDKLYIERYNENHLKSGSHTNSFYGRQRLKN